MTRIEIDEATAHRLTEQAREKGLTLAEFLRLIAGAASNGSGVNGEAEARKRLEAYDRFAGGVRRWTRDHLPSGHHADDRRESIYGDDADARR